MDVSMYKKSLHKMLEKPDWEAWKYSFMIDF